MRALLASGASSLFLFGAAFAAEPVPGEQEGGLPQLDASTYASQIFWLLLTFGALYFVLSRIFLPRLGGVIEERRNRIADDYDQAAEFKRQAEEAQAGYEKALADAKARAASIAAETRASIDAEIAEMEEENDARLDAKIHAAEARIAETAERARDAVFQAARETTREIVSSLTGEAPSEADVDDALTTAREDIHARAA
ncbi:F0F1 ATP synthase subunit B' [Parvularcula dongshanensis]|uniref:ATP synthase subunit b n=1 Tax=Parvularcula dongshanensis TaxID=1173995 RepID=A0A840I379_9PROT|nr:F0F1 ATP synthase subunit B' [Parvularcula dongshanensis]MBB4658752.1 F-type H+-transporting ATPase subunit b [Parvularcula dongshanensis]